VSRLKQFRLPDLGEGLTEGEILTWLVKPGDTVTLNQPIVEVETAKAAVEVPSPYAGTVTEVHHQVGETVDVGSPIITFDTEPGAAPLPAGPPDDLSGGVAARAAEQAAAGAAAVPAKSVAAVAGESRVETPPEEGAVEPGLIGGPAPGGRTSVLVGYGPKSVVAKRRARKAAATAAPTAAEPSVGAAWAVVAEPSRVLAKPPVRKLARDLGVDLSALVGSGPDGTVTREDVHAATPARVAAAPVLAAAGDQRIPIKGVRKLTAEAMVASAYTAPHVTEFITVDVTRMMEAVTRLKTLPELAGVRVSPLLLVAKALLLACRRHPMINSSWDGAAQEIVVKGSVNLGIAAATPRGLVVPNIKGADSMNLVRLAGALGGLVSTAKEGRTPPADLTGGSITITNVGVYGVDTGTPILNPGESAILAFGAVRDAPWVHEGELAIRKVTQLAVSFDHRIVDGELGSLFLADVAAFLHDPGAALLAWT